MTKRDQIMTTTVSNNNENKVTVNQIGFSGSFSKFFKENTQVDDTFFEGGNHYSFTYFINQKHTDMKKIKLVVYNEYCLGYILPKCPNMVCILSDSVLKGAPFRVMNEPYQITKSDKIRLASEKDFENFRVSFEGYDNRELYEYL